MHDPRTKFGWLVAAVLAATAPANAQPQPAEINVVIQAEPTDLDPCTIGHPVTGFVSGQNIIETLTTLDPDTGEVKPRLATYWEQLASGAWRLELREGVKFHDGTDFNAEAVAAAIRRLANSELVCSGALIKLDKFDIATEIVDENTIDIIADKAPLPIPAYVAHVGIGGLTTPDKEIDRDPVGTGPYSFQSWEAGTSIVLSRFDGYWGDKPEVEKVTFLFRKEPRLRAAMVEVGEADLAVHIAPQDATNPAMDFSYPNRETTRIRMVLQPPLDDIRVRKALNLAFDREALIGTILSDAVEPASQLMSKEVNGYNPDLALWSYDLEEAKRLIEEAKADGVPVDKELRLIGHPTFYPNVGEVLQAMAQMWNDAGLNVRVEMMERAQWKKLVNKPYDADRAAMLIQEMHDNTEGDAVFTMRFRYHTDGGQSEFSNPVVDKLVVEAEQAEGDERRDKFREANRIIADEIVPAVPMYHMVNYMRVGPRLSFRPGGFYSAGMLEVSRIKFSATQ